MAEHICARAAMLEQGLWDKTLTEAQLAELQAHAQECAECAKVLAGVTRAQQGLQAWREEAMSAPSTAASWDKVKVQLPTPKQERGGRFMKIAAMVALVLTAGAVTFMQVLPDGARDYMALSRATQESPEPLDALGLTRSDRSRRAADEPLFSEDNRPAASVAGGSGEQANADADNKREGEEQGAVSYDAVAGSSWADTAAVTQHYAVSSPGVRQHTFTLRNEASMPASVAAPSVARDERHPHPGVPEIGLPTPYPGPGEPEAETDELVPYAQQRLQQDASIGLRVEDAAKAHKRVIELMAAAGGMLVSSQLSSDGDNGAASRMTLRIPAAKFDAFIADVHQLGEVETESIGAQDRTRDEQRLKREVEQRTQRVDELQQQVQQEQNERRRQSLERQLQRAQRQQAQAQRAQQQLTQAIDYATLHLTLRQNGMDADGFTALMQEAWRVAQKHFGKGLAVIVIGIGSCLPWAAVAVLFWHIINRRKRNW